MNPSNPLYLGGPTPGTTNSIVIEKNISYSSRLTNLQDSQSSKKLECK